MAKSDKHPGFVGAAGKIARRQHIPIKNASAELAAATRGASKLAKKHNPRLKRVK